MEIKACPTAHTPDVYAYNEDDYYDEPSESFTKTEMVLCVGLIIVLACVYYVTELFCTVTGFVRRPFSGRKEK